MSDARRAYARSLNLLDYLAVADLQDWWSGHNRFDRDPEELLDEAQAPFADLVARYGDVAAEAAVDYLVMERSLDQELRYLPKPDAAEAASFAQARSSLQWAVRTSVEDGTFNDRLALRKLSGVVNRLVLQPARETVWNATVRDGTRYARVPEPGACPFCLMLASRGAVYSRETVVATKDMHRYHDNCRCLGIEAARATDEDPFVGLPPVNRQLRQMWDTEIAAAGVGSDEARRAWGRLVVHHRRARAGDAAVRWPPIAGVGRVRYRGSGTTTVFGEPEPLPDLAKMPGHVLFGWTDDRDLPPVADGPVDTGREAHTRALQEGHRWSSQRGGATVFPKSWSDQKIVDAVRDTIEDPDEYQPARKPGVPRVVRKTVDGVVIEAKWRQVRGEAKLDYAYPVRGDGVYWVTKEGEKVDPPKPHEKDKKFRPVER